MRPWIFHRRWPAGGAQRPALYELFLKLEFAKLIEKLGLKAVQGDASVSPAQVGSCESEVVTKRERMEELLSLWRTRDHVSVLALPI